MMTRTLIASVIALHGIIHLMGFVKEWKLGPVGKFSSGTSTHFSENTARFVGLLWLLTCVLMLSSALLYYKKTDWVWMTAVAGLLISQTLIIIYWSDAKWGTLFNVLLFVVVSLAIGHRQFNKMVQREVKTLLAESSAERRMVTEEDLEYLPLSVQTWLRKSNVVGQRVPRSVFISQRGSMRATVEGNWMPFEARQYFTMDPPAFVWKATIHTDKYIDLEGRDKYMSGQGNMLVKAASVIPVANSSGKEIDQGSLVRYMAEIIWFPHAAVSDYFDWEEVDNTHARVTMSYHDLTASGIYTFNTDGLPVRFEAERFGTFDGKFSKETWSVSISQYEYVNGVPIAQDSEVTWKLKTGEFKWLKLHIIDVQFSHN